MATKNTARTPYATRNGVDEDTRRKLAALLNQTLADTSDLYSQTKQAHWNVKGKGFYQLHLLYDELAEKLEEPPDLVAERIVLLGGYAFGTVRMAAQNSRIAPFPGTDQTGDEDAMNDPSFLTPLADLYDRITHIADRGTWFVEAHLQRYDGGLPNDGQDPK